MRKTIKEIVKGYLQQIGADGLCNSGLGDGLGCSCGCGLDELFICECPDWDNCIPAKKIYCKDCPHAKDCWLREEYSAEYCYVPLDEAREFLKKGGDIKRND